MLSLLLKRQKNIICINEIGLTIKNKSITI